MFLSNSNPNYYAISKCLYCIQSLRGTLAALSFWLVDTHARMLAISFYKSFVLRSDGTESQTNESSAHTSIDEYMCAKFHIEEVGVGVDGKSISFSNRNQKNVSSSGRFSSDISSISGGEYKGSISSEEMFSVDPNYGFTKP